MPRDQLAGLAGLAASTSSSGIERMFGVGPLPPPRYTLRIRAAPGGALPGDIAWAVRSFALNEAVHAPYALDVHAIASTPDFELGALVGARVDLEIVRGNDQRVVHGLVLRAVLVGDDGDGTRVRFQGGPALDLLRLTRRSRVFQGCSVVEIAQTVMAPVLTGYDRALRVDRLLSTYEPRDYCVQYRETDLGFVLRILAEEGITLLFDHEGESETVVLVDCNQALPAAGLEPLSIVANAIVANAFPMLPLLPDRPDEVSTESILAVAQQRSMGPERWSCSVWDWKSRPMGLLAKELATELATELDSTKASPPWVWSQVDEGRPGEGEHTDSPIVDVSSTQAQYKRKRDEATILRLSANTNATVLRAGSVFELARPPHDGYHDTWVVTCVRHRGDAPHVSVHGSADGAGVSSVVEYANEIECQPHAVPIIPERLPRPIVAGVHTAVVTGPPGEVIHTDSFGRVRVRMLWDEHTPKGEETSCWLRVAMPWAGDGFGTVFIPRVGTEVVVSFVDGDPDRPLCTGCVYDGANMPPYPLPEHKTRTVLRTASIDGGGFNELSFEDAAGTEEVYLHAQRNLREVVQAEHATWNGARRSQVVGGSRIASIGKDDVVSVAGDQAHTIEGDVTQQIRGAYRLRVSEAPKQPVGLRGIGVVVDHGKYEVEAKEAIILRCGACRLEIHPTKILLSGPEIVAQCPSQAAAHSTEISLTEGGIELATDQLRQRAVNARLEADRRVVLGVGPDGAQSSLCLADDDATLRAHNTMKLRARALFATGTETTSIKGSTCEVAGETVDINGKRVGIDADARIEITTQGQVNVVGQEQIKLN
jgi:type VI secretion system secreted protein VgrG